MNNMDSETKNINFATFTIYFCASISILASAIIAPAMGVISDFLGEGINETLIRLILPMPSLLVIPSCILAIPLCKKYGKKRILICALFIYGVMGCLVGFMSNIYSILVARALFGIGIGLLSPIAPMLFLDKKICACVMFVCLLFILWETWL